MSITKLMADMGNYEISMIRLPKTMWGVIEYERVFVESVYAICYN